MAMDWEQPLIPEEEEKPKKGLGPIQAGTVLFLVLTVIVFLCYLAIFINPQMPLNPFKPPVVRFPTPTRAVAAAVATFTIPPTFTPPPTYPPTWTPTPTPTPTATFTPRPTSTPTFTPGPIPPFSLRWDPIYTKQELYPNASDWWTGVAGEVTDKAGKPITYVTIKVWDDRGHVWEAKPGDAPAYGSKYGSVYGGRGTYAWWEQFLFASCHESFTVHVQVISAGKGVSPVVTVKTTGTCDKNLIIIHFEKNY